MDDDLKRFDEELINLIIEHCMFAGDFEKLQKEGLGELYDAVIKEENNG